MLAAMYGVKFFGALKCLDVIDLVQSFFDIEVDCMVAYY